MEEVNFPFSKLKSTIAPLHLKFCIPGLSFISSENQTNTTSENLLLPLGPGNKLLPSSDSLSFPLSSHMTKLYISAQHSAVWVLPFFPPFSSSWSLDTPSSSLDFKLSSRLIFRLRKSFSSCMSISISLQPDPQC